MSMIDKAALKEKYDYLVVGAGLYGSVMARELTDRGCSVLVIEKRGQIAGNCYTEKTDGICVHKYGPHIFHTDNEEVWKYVNRFAQFNDFVNRPVTVSGGRLYPLPFNMDTFFRLWGISDPDDAREKIRKQAEEALKGKTPENLEEQAISMAGNDIYEKLIKGYSEKQWGRDCRELPASIIKRLRISFDHNSDYFGDRYQGIPDEGYTAMTENILRGIKVITGIDYDSPEIRMQTENIADVVIYTGSIDRYYAYRLGRLKYRSIRFDEIRLDGVQDFQGRAVINYAEKSVPYTRITEHKHFDTKNNKTDAKFTIISKEFPEDHNDSNEPMYPVCDGENLRLYMRYRELADRDPGLHFGGRLGTYRYLDMDDVIASALADSSMLIERHESHTR